MAAAAAAATPAATLRSSARIAGADRSRQATTRDEHYTDDLSSEDEAGDSPDSDLEWEADWKRLQKPKLADLKGKELYAALCSRYETSPLKSLERSIDGETVIVNHSGLGVAGARAMSAPLCASKRLRVLRLEDSMLGPKGAAIVSRVLHGNAYITEIDLSHNRIGSAGAAHVCSAIQHSVAITKVNLTGNEFEDSDGAHVAEIIENNFNIKELILAHNRLSVRAGQLMAAALANNDTIEVLDLSWNQLRLKGAQEIAQALAVNRGLKVLNLSMNGFSMDGARALGISLSKNKYLEDLDVSFNRISSGAAAEFSKCLKLNTELRILKIYGNPIIGDGVAEIMNAISSNVNSNLHYLDIRDLRIYRDFPKAVLEIQKQRVFEARVDTLVQSSKARRRTLNLACKAVLEFIRSLTQDGLPSRNLSDHDKALPLSRQELALELKKAKIPLTSQQRDKLLDSVVEGSDGFIDFGRTLAAAQSVLLVGVQ